MKKIKLFILSVIATLFFTSTFNNEAKAEEGNDVNKTVYYVDASGKGSDSNNGTEDAPFKTLDKALKSAGNDIEIRLLGNATYQIQTDSSVVGTGKNSVSIIGDPNDKPTIKLAYGSSGDVDLATNLTLSNIKYASSKASSRHAIYCNGYDLTFDIGCETDWGTFPNGDPLADGIEYGLNFQIYAGGNGNSANPEVPPSRLKTVDGVSNGYYDNTITLLSGDFGKVAQANRTCNTGTSTLPVKSNVVIGGDTYVSLVVGSNDWRAYVDGSITVKDDARIYRIVGGSLGYPYSTNSERVRQKVYQQYGTSRINIDGGAVAKIIGGSYGRGTAKAFMDGDVEINVTAGEIEKVIGGSAAGRTVGDISINISGGTFGPITDKKFGFYRDGKSTGNIATTHNCGVYGGGAGKSDMVTTDQIYEDFFNEARFNEAKNFDAKGQGYNSEENLYNIYKNKDGNYTIGEVSGKVTTTITGGTFNCDIYGGGEGFDYHHTEGKTNGKLDLFNIAQVTNGVTLNVSGATINGNVFGGGAGKEVPSDCKHNAENLYPLIARVSPSITFNIGSEDKAVKTIINGTVYGGGEYPLITSDGNIDIPVVNLKINNTTINNPDGVALVGGSKVSDVEGAIDISIDNGCDINGAIYVGSGTGDIRGNVGIVINNSTVQGNLNLGSQSGEIYGDVTVSIKGLTEVKDINIGSETGEIDGKVNVSIDDTVVKGDINIGTDKDKFDNGIKVEITKTIVDGSIVDKTDSDIVLEIDENTSVNGIVGNPVVLKVESTTRAKGTISSVEFEAKYLTGHVADGFTYEWYKVDDLNDKDSRTETLIAGANTMSLSLGAGAISMQDQEMSYGYFLAIRYEGKIVFRSNIAHLYVKSEVKGVNVDFDANPILNFYVDLSTGYKGEQATITIADRTIKASGVKCNDLGYETYKFSVEIAPYETGEMATISIGGTENILKSFSVAKYCRIILAGDESYSNELKALIIALANYGQRAQDYFEFESTNSANEFLTEDQKNSVSNTITDTYKAVIENNSAEIEAYAATVEVGVTTTVRVFVVAKDDVTVDINDFIATVNGEEYEITERGGKYLVEITGIKAAMLGDDLEVVFTKDDDYVSIKYSAMCYCYNRYRKTDDLKEKKFVLAMYDYAKLAKSYAEVQ